jgi:DNA-directed RNA polymerase II subunit RPB1
MGLVQDALLGASLLSREATRISRRHMVELRSLLRYPRQKLGTPGASDGYTGRQAFSMLLPPDLDYVNNKATPPVVVRTGQLLTGRLCKQSLGTSFGGLVHRLWLQYGPTLCAQFLSDAQRLVNRWLTWHGFSVRLSDCEPGPGVQDKVQAIVRLAEEKVRRIESNDDIRRHVPRDMEAACSSITNKMLTKVGKVVHASLDEDTNALYQTVGAGSKGNLINVAQLIGVVGQQSLEGRRINGVRNGFVQVPISEPGSVVRPKGFVKSSYYGGLDPAEFFFHSMAGREGLVDTAVKTATTGYLQRRLMKAMETLGVAYDGTVRNSRDHVVQFVYGADGFDASFLVRHELRWYGCGGAPPPEGAFAALGEAEAYASVARRVRAARLRPAGDVCATAYSPCRVVEVLVQARGAAEARRSSPPAGPKRAFAELESLCEAVCRCWWGRRSCLELHLRWELRSSVTGCLSVAQLTHVAQALRRQVWRALVAPGEMVGAIAAQSIGEPTSQSTLNTFHHAGVAAKNVTLGVPRIKELIDCTKHMKTPSMRLVATPAFGEAAAARHLAPSLVYLPLGLAVRSASVVHAPDFFSSACGPVDQYICAREAVLAPDAPVGFCPFVVRLELDPVPLLERDLGPAEAAEAAAAHFGTGTVQVLYSEEHMDIWVLRLRPLGLTAPNVASEGAYLRAAAQELGAKACRDCIIGGVPGVTSAITRCDAIATLHGPMQPVLALDTDGTNLRAALGLPELRAELCTTNDVADVLAVLGIEAASTMLFQELTNTLQFDGCYINERHVMLLVDLMTSLGQLLPISRHGLNRKLDNGPIARSSFEETVDVLYDAAAYGEIDPVRGVTESVMMGQRAFIGTGVCEAVPSKLPESADPQRQPELPDLEYEDDDVVFTTVDADVELSTTKTDVASAPMEMPFDGGSGGAPVCRGGSASSGGAAASAYSTFAPGALGHSFLNVSAAPSAPTRPYAPSSPKRAAPEPPPAKKRRLDEPDMPGV